MWAKSALLSALIAAGALTAPADAPLHQDAAFQPNWMVLAQDRRGGRGESDQRNLRPLREIIDELRARYGGEYHSHYQEPGTSIYVIRWRMPDGRLRDFREDARR